jgi:predicted NBD/HSP70 family sugar kinase
MTNSKGNNQQDLKKQNRALVLKLICTGMCSSRPDIARQTGLTKMTVTNVINELILSGFIHEGEASEKTTVGRKAVYLHPTDENYFSIGVYLSRDFITFSLITLRADIVKKQTVDLDDNESRDTIIDKLFAGIDKIIGETGIEKILGIGVATIGPLDIEGGALLSPTDFNNINNIEFKKIIEEKTGLSVFVNNDMNAAALAELLYGKQSRSDNFIYLGITHGIGSGIVINGSLYTGESGFSGEIGHISINFDGPLCACGNKGCLEVYASIPNIVKTVRNQTGIEYSFSQIVEYAKANKTSFTEIIDDLCFYIGIALANSINTLDSKIIYLGHDGALGGEYFASKIEEVLNSKILFRNSKHVAVEISSFMDQAPVVGSGVLVLNDLFS